MDIADEISLKADKAADLNVLTDRHDLLLKHLLDGHAVGACAGLQCVNISGILLKNNLGKRRNELIENRILGNEIRLGIHLKNNTDLFGLIDH